MSFHELLSGYPWLTKRFARIKDTDAKLPNRNGFAYILAIFIPYAGRLGGGFGFLIMIYIVGVMAAIAIPAYNDYTIRAKVAEVVLESQAARDALTQHYEESREIPESLSQIDIASTLSDGSELELDTENMALTVTTAKGSIVFVPEVDSDGRISWTCTNGEGLKPSHLPASCRSEE